MIDVDDLIRDFRSALPTPPARPPREVAERARQASVDRRGRPALPRTRRALAIAFVTVGGAAILGILAFLLIQTPSDDPSAATSPDWGLQIAVSVTPEGTRHGLADLTSHAARVIEARATAFGMNGVVAAAREPGRLAITVPTAKSDIQVADLLVETNPRVYDLSRGVMATATDPAGLLPALRTAAAEPGAKTAYVVAFIPAFSASPSSFGPAAATREALLAKPDRFPKRAQIVEVPEGVAIVWADNYLSNGAQGSGARYWLVRDAPVVTADDVVTVTADGDRIVPELTAPARERLADAISASPSRVADGTVSNLVLSLGKGFGTYGAIGVLRVDPSSPGTPAFRTYDAGSARFVGALLAGGGLEATLALESMTRFRNEPPLLGEVPETLPPQVNVSGVAGTSRQDVRRVLSAQGANGTWNIYAARPSQGGDDQSWTIRSGASAREAFANGLCNVGPGAPAITSCGVYGPRFNPTATIATIDGRVRDDVARVEARYEGGAVEAGTVQNGWFLMILPKGEGPKAVVALAADGRVLGSLGSPFEPRAFHPGG